MTSSNGTIFRVTGPLCGNSPVPVNSPHKGQWREALMFSLICAWLNDWVNNREAGDLRRHRGHYDVNIMIQVSHHIKAFWRVKQNEVSIKFYVYGCKYKKNNRDTNNTI